MLARYEWIIVELLVLGLLVAELISVRRAVRRDRAERDAKKADKAQK